MSPPDMQAMHFSTPGDPEVLVPARRPIPVPQAGEVRIRTRYAGMNGADLVQRRGHYPAPEGASDLLGLEVSGEIAELGEGVHDFEVGDRVCALLPGGGYAEYCTTPAAQVLKLPRHISFTQGAGIIETTATVWFNLFMKAGIKAGETLLVHGGTSGIGTTAIQIASRSGIKVFCTVGSPEKVKAALALGAQRAINYREEAIADVIKQETADGVDVILDIIGGPYLANNIQSLAQGGRLVIIAFSGGRHAEIDLARIMLRELTVTGSTLRRQPLARKAAIVAAVKRHVWPMLMDGRFTPVIDREFALSDAASAHRCMENGGHIGKIVLRIA